jgi:hypothetical protein
MPPSSNHKCLAALKTFANDLRNSYGSLIRAQPEDQLKAPTRDLLSVCGGEFGLNVVSRFEAPVKGVGRPDIALDVDGLLCGYVELKAPETTHRFKPLLERAGLPHFRFHDLRHTCATLLLGKNVTPKIVSEMLRHANIAITLDTYSHVLPTMQDSAAKAIEDALS